MGWFSFKGSRSEVGSTVEKGGPAGETVIGPGSRLIGDLHGSMSVRIEGQVEGSILGAETVTVAPTGSVVGAIEAGTVRLEGRIEGDVRAAKRFELGPSGALIGNVAAPAVSIAEGSVLQGELYTREEMVPSKSVEFHPQPLPKTPESGKVTSRVRREPSHRF